MHILPCMKEHVHGWTRVGMFIYSHVDKSAIKNTICVSKHSIGMAVQCAHPESSSVFPQFAGDEDL